MSDQRLIDALKRERAAYVASGNVERADQVDVELRRLGAATVDVEVTTDTNTEVETPESRRGRRGRPAEAEGE